MQTQNLEGGFIDPAIDAAHVFRAVMQAMARPGTIHRVSGAVPPKPLSRAAGATVLTLCDSETPVYLAGAMDCPDLRDWIAFHTGAALTGPGHCMFALGHWQDLLPLSAYPIGTPDYPDRSATLIVETARLGMEGPVLRGPGIRQTAALSLPETRAFQLNHALFPQGLDFLFACDDRLAALPRSTEVA